MRLFVLLLAIGSALAAQGCGDEKGEVPDEGTILEYSQSGGIAGSYLEVVIDADGTGTARAGTNPEGLKENEFELSDSELAELRSILEENPISSFPEQPDDTACYDCFEYSFAYGGDEYTTDDASEPVKGLNEVGGFVVKLGLDEVDPKGD